MYSWDFRLVDPQEQVSDEVAEGIHRAFLDGLNLAEGWSIEGAKRVFSRSTVAGLLTQGEQEIEGYAFYNIPEVQLDGSYMIWEDGICLKKHLQGRGLASFERLLAKICGLFPGRAFGWVGGRTQNPLVILRYARLGTNYPFDAKYSEGEGQTLLRFLVQNIADVNEVKATLDYSTGICRGLYPEGRLGDYGRTIDGAEAIECSLAEWGFDRNAGDAVITATRLSSPFIGRAQEVKETAPCD